MEMRWAIFVSAYSSTVDMVSVSEYSARVRTAWAFGLDLRHVGGDGMSRGMRTDAMAACTSCAALSMSRLRTNCRVMLVLPRPLFDVIWSTPGMLENCFSRGSATTAAMVSGSAPGRLANTLIVG